MRKVIILMSVSLLLMACGNRKPSTAELMQKIDSVKALEISRQLKAQGINLDEANPLKMFYDSLALQPLPMTYSEEYVALLPGYTEVPVSIAAFLELDGQSVPKAIALPEMMNSRLLLVASDVADGEYELWLYSLDDEFIPVDKMLLYEPKKYSDKKLVISDQYTYFSITSDCEINVMEYVDDEDNVGQLSTFIVDESRQFVEKQKMY